FTRVLMRPCILHPLVIVLAAWILSGNSTVYAGDLPDWFYAPLGTVGPLGKVGPLGTVGPLGKEGSEVKIPETLRDVADTAYITCWSWNIAKDSTWRCTGKYEENPRNASDFSAYQY